MIGGHEVVDRRAWSESRPTWCATRASGCMAHARSGAADVLRDAPRRSRSSCSEAAVSRSPSSRSASAAGSTPPTSSSSGRRGDHLNRFRSPGAARSRQSSRSPSRRPAIIKPGMPVVCGELPPEAPRPSMPRRLPRAQARHGLASTATDARIDWAGATRRRWPPRRTPERQRAGRRALSSRSTVRHRGLMPIGRSAAGLRGAAWPGRLERSIIGGARRAGRRRAQSSRRRRRWRPTSVKRAGLAWRSSSARCRTRMSTGC